VGHLVCACGKEHAHCEPVNFIQIYGRGPETCCRLWNFIHEIRVCLNWYCGVMILNIFYCNFETGKPESEVLNLA
jgi:hypothetical protein